MGGDFYDFFRIDDDHLGFVMADVSGKGVPAALFMTMSYTLLRFTGTKSLNPVSTISDSNAMLSKESFDSMFVTVFYGVYSISTGEIRYVNAGHNPPYLLKADGSVNMLPNSSNICLGVTENFPYQESTLKLEKGDTLVTFTDGVTEACDSNNNLYGEERLEALLATQQSNTAEQVTTAINDAVNAHANGAEQSDDITILVIKRK